MVSLDLDALLTPVSPEAPCGKDLEYDAEFLSLMAAVRAAPLERLIGPSAPAEEPNWQLVARQAAALFQRTKDLRIASAFAKAQLRLAGLAGFSSGIKLLRALVERYWDTVHPGLDPSDHDATMRVNALREICDRQGILDYLRNPVPIAVPGLGRFTLKELAAAAGVGETTSSSSAADSTKLDVAFANCDLAGLRASVATLQEAADDLHAIERFVTQQLGARQGMSFEELTTVLEQMHRLLAARLSKREPLEVRALSGTAPENDLQPMNLTDSRTAAANGTASSTHLTAVRSRADVRQMLDLLCAYYENFEPSSPVPLLLRRAQRLSAMSFMEIVRDLAPAGMAEVEIIRGGEGPNVR